MAVGTAPEIPLISLTHSTPEEVLKALSTVGFIHLDLEGTGIEQSDIDRAFELSELIHSVPPSERKAYWKNESGNGYLGQQNSLDERTTKPDFKEQYTWGRFDASAGESASTQILPPSVQKFRAELVQFDIKCFETSMRVLDILSRAFKLPENYFRSLHKDAGSNALTFLNYPALDRMPEGDDIRAGSHKGKCIWGDITLLFQEKNGQPGLQVYIPTEAVKKTKGYQLVQGNFDLESGTWISAPIVPNTVLVNVGLALEVMTNGLCKANVHRVVFPPAPPGTVPKARKSIPYFSTPSSDVLMNQVEQGGKVIKIKGALTVGEFFKERMRLAFG